MEYKFLELAFEVRETKETSSGFFNFEGYASTKDLDLVDDVVIPTAFNDSIAGGLPLPMLWQHDRYEPIGVFTEATADDKGLFVKGQMPTADSLVSGRIVPQIKAGSIKAMSIGYRVAPGGAMIRDDGVRVITKADLMEVSLVTFPANPEARITALKELEDAERRAVGSPAREELTGENGKLDFRAVVLERVRVGLKEAPTEEETKHIAELYEELELDPPGLLSLQEVKALPTSALRDVLRCDTIKLSRKAADAIADAFKVKEDGEEKGEGVKKDDDAADALRGLLEAIQTEVNP